MKRSMIVDDSCWTRALVWSPFAIIMRYHELSLTSNMFIIYDCWLLMIVFPLWPRAWLTGALRMRKQPTALIFRIELELRNESQPSTYDAVGSENRTRLISQVSCSTKLPWLIPVFYCLPTEHEKCNMDLNCQHPDRPKFLCSGLIAKNSVS